MDMSNNKGSKGVKINFIWIVSVLSVLLAVSISFNVIGFSNVNNVCQENNSKVVEYISFATTILSLVLSIIAIIYSFISTVEGTRQWSQIESAVSEIRATNTNIQSSEQQMVSAVIDIATKLGTIDANTNPNSQRQNNQNTTFSKGLDIPSNEKSR